jgi:hypothetical protein
MVGKAQKLHEVRSALYGGYSNGVLLIHFHQAEHRIHGRYFEKETITASPQSFDSE